MGRLDPQPSHPHREVGPVLCCPLPPAELGPGPGVGAGLPGGSGSWRRTQVLAPGLCLGVQGGSVVGPTGTTMSSWDAPPCRVRGGRWSVGAVGMVRGQGRTSCWRCPERALTGVRTEARPGQRPGTQGQQRWAPPEWGSGLARRESLCLERGQGQACLRAPCSWGTPRLALGLGLSPQVPGFLRCSEACAPRIGV